MMRRKTIESEAERITQSYTGALLREQVVELVLRAVDEALKSMLKERK